MGFYIKDCYSSFHVNAYYSHTTHLRTAILINIGSRKFNVKIVNRETKGTHNLQSEGKKSKKNVWKKYPLKLKYCESVSICKNISAPTTRKTLNNNDEVKK